MTTVHSHAVNALLPDLYGELRKLAAAKLATERPDHTLQPTALVHEVYLRFLNGSRDSWKTKQDFMAAAAEAMRRILVDNARARNRLKRGGKNRRRIPLDDLEFQMPTKLDANLLELEEALATFESVAPDKAMVVKLRYYIGLTFDEIAEVLSISRSTAIRRWNYSRAWLLRRVKAASTSSESKNVDRLSP